MHQLSEEILSFYRQTQEANRLTTHAKGQIETGYHRNPTDDLKYFTDAYLHRPETLSSEVIEAGFQHQATLAVEGPAWLFESFKNYWEDPDLRLVVLDLIRKVEAEPSILGMSAHILAIGTK